MKRTAWAAAFLATWISACGGGGSGGSGFDSSGVVEEASTIDQSGSPDWWLSSGGRFALGGGGGETIQGDLPPGDRWRQEYAQSNPRDTDGGAHPQNVFRLLRRAVFGDLHASVAFNVRRTNLTDSPSRNGSNGVFLFTRYLDENRLYVSGIRVDGFAVVKRKEGGRYATLGEAPVFAGAYDRNRSPNLIPADRWITLDEDTVSESGGSVVLRLWVDGNLALEVRDDGRSFGGAALRDPGLVGIRSDFMDVEFRGFDVQS